jgi:hypothetical protein
MRDYIVTWTITIPAESHEAAACEALEIQRDPDSIATVFDVRDAKRWRDRREIDVGNKWSDTIGALMTVGKTP